MNFIVLVSGVKMKYKRGGRGSVGGGGGGGGKYFPIVKLLV